MHSKEFFDSISQFRTCGWKVLLHQEAKLRRCTSPDVSITFPNFRQKPNYIPDVVWEFYFYQPHEAWLCFRWLVNIHFLLVISYVPRVHSFYTLLEVVSVIFKIHLTCSSDLVFRPYFPLPPSRSAIFWPDGMYWDLLKRAVYTASITQKLKFCYNVF